MFQITIIGDKVRIMSNQTGQEIYFKRSDILELQREINHVFPNEEHSVPHTVKNELLDIAKFSNDPQSRVSACQLLLEYFLE